MYVPLEFLFDKAKCNMYRLVHMVSRRALQLAEGAPKMIDAPIDMKVTTLAMLEIAQKKVGMELNPKASE
jgi:DNA-directed RNA polymerase subunit K/omega